MKASAFRVSPSETLIHKLTNRDKNPARVYVLKSILLPVCSTISLKLLQSFLISVNQILFCSSEPLMSRYVQVSGPNHVNLKIYRI